MISRKIQAAEIQCGNYRIFLILTFYVKSSLVILRSQNLPFFTHLVALNFKYDEFLHFLKALIYKMAKTAVLQLTNSPKLISRKI